MTAAQAANKLLVRSTLALVDPSAACNGRAGLMEAEVAAQIGAKFASEPQIFRWLDPAEYP